MYPHILAINNGFFSGFNTNEAIISLVVDIRDSLWSVAFSTKNYWFNVHGMLWDSRFHMAGPSSLLLNPDKSFKAFGSDAEDEVDRELGNYYYFRRFATAFYSKRVSINSDVFTMYVPLNMNMNTINEVGKKENWYLVNG